MRAFYHKYAIDLCPDRLDGDVTLGPSNWFRRHRGDLLVGSFSWRISS
jgi:hypothetical protein